MVTGAKKKTAERKNRIMAALLTGALAVTFCLGMPETAQTAKAAADTVLQNPRVKMNTCETVYFGSYWQEDTDGDGVVDEKDEKQPIRWRILSRNGDDAYVIADKVLDCRKYNETDTAVTWETCTLRDWLNEEFLNNAFTEQEQTAIIKQTLVNAGNGESSTQGGADTTDKVYLPSIADIGNPAYGFSGVSSFGDQARLGKGTTYAENQGLSTLEEKGSWWWLRSPGNNSNRAVYIDTYGCVSSAGYTVNYSHYGIRPVLHLNLSSAYVRVGETVNISLESAEWDLVELGTYKGKPIRWRVLQKEGNDVYLLSEKVLVDRAYNGTTWKDSTLRNWLNGEFYAEVFNDTEKVGIKKCIYENKDNPWNHTEGGENTEDFVTLLSLDDIANPKYGFSAEYACWNSGRIAYNQEGVLRSWWLRSPGGVTNRIADVHSSGYVDTYGFTDSSGHPGVRPALHFNLSSSTPLKKAGTVDNNGIITGGDEPGECTKHSPVTDAAVKPSCEKQGKTEGSHCSVCGRILTKQEVIPATGHKWNNGTVTKQPTATEDGEKTFTCTVCGKTKTEKINATEPDEPVTPDRPVTPDKPTEPDKPITPDKPVTPDKPEPSVPSVPGGKTDTTVKVEHVKLSGETKKLAAGKKMQLTAVITPDTATEKSLTWKSSNPKYATVDCSGKVTAKKKGAGKTVTITATAKDGSGVKASYKIRVMKDAVKSVKLSKPPKSVKAGKTVRLKVSVKTTGKKANKTLQWQSSNKKYATVTKKGVVKAKRAGKGKIVKITVRSTDGSKKKASVKLKIR